MASAGDKRAMVEEAHNAALQAAQQVMGGQVGPAARGYDEAVRRMGDVMRHETDPTRRQTMEGHIRDWEAQAAELRARQLGQPPAGRGGQPAAGAAHRRGEDGGGPADLCENCYNKPKISGHDFCGKWCGQQTPLPSRNVQLWNHTGGEVDVAGSTGLIDGAVGRFTNKNILTNQGEVLKFTCHGELFGEWTVTKHLTQHVFAEVDPTTGRATVRAMVCEAVPGEPAYTRCRNAPTKAAGESIRKAGQLPTIEQVAPFVGLQGFTPPERQRAIDRQRAGTPAVPAAPAAPAAPVSSAPEPQAGAAMGRSDSGCTFRSLGVPDNLCRVLESEAKPKPKYAQRRVIELLYKYGNAEVSRTPVRLLIDSETGMQAHQYRDHARGYEDAAALTLICPFLNERGEAVKSRCGPARAICVVSNAAKSSEGSMDCALDKFVRAVASGGRKGGGLTYQRLSYSDHEVLADVVLADASTIVRMIHDRKINAASVRTLVMRDADVDCATYNTHAKKLFGQLKRAGAKPGVLFCARKPRDQRHYNEIKRFATTHAAPCDEWSAQQQARAEAFSRSAPQADLGELKREKVARLRGLLDGSSARARDTAQNREGQIAELFDELQQIHDEMERLGQSRGEVAALREELDMLGDQFAADLLDDFDDFDDGADGSRMHTGGGGGAAGAPPPSTPPAFNPAARPPLSVAELYAQAPAATWESLGGFCHAGRLAGAAPIHREECSLVKAKAICGFGTPCVGTACTHQRCAGHSTSGEPIQGVVAFTFEDQKHTGKGTVAGPKPLGKVACIFYGAGVQAHSVEPNWYSYICPGQDVPGAVDPGAVDPSKAASTVASTAASTGDAHARDRRITADNDRRAGGSAPPAMCSHCKVKPVFVEGSGRNQKVHKFCGKSCADAAKQPSAAGAPVGQRTTVPFDQRGYHARLPRVIKFYEKLADFYEFTNFWECDHLVIDGMKWPTSEHYFQAQKFAAWPTLVEQCRTQPTPRECFDMVRNPVYKPYVRDDWHRGNPSVKDQVMYNAVMHKFTQDRTLKHLLLSTAAGGERRMIIEHTTNDDYWGDGGAPRWQVGDSGNKLGQLLVRIRDEIQYNTLQGGGAGYMLPLAHRAAGLAMPPPQSVAAAAPAGGGGRMCAMCRAKPARDGHDYCGRTCGTAASQAGLTTQHSRAGGRGGRGGVASAAPSGSYGHGNYSAAASPAGYGQHQHQHQHQPHQHQPHQHQVQHQHQHQHQHQPHQMQHQVTCPAGAVPGQHIQVRLGTGETKTVIVPAGVGPGMNFFIQ
eukprot:COSAG02_NODE_268_length_26526_cov_28.495554_7_plen_1277_part_00